MFSLSINESPVWLACAAALALSAIIYAGYRLFVRPRKWRLRALADICPACKYDLSKPKTTRCPECGLDVTTNGGRPTPRQRRRVLLLFIVLIGLSLNIFLGKPWERSRESWSRVLPTTLLMVCVPTAANDYDSITLPYICTQRFNDSEMWNWQERWMLRKMCYLTTTERNKPFIKFRDRWPKDVPVYIEDWYFRTERPGRWPFDVRLRDPRGGGIVGWSCGPQTSTKWHIADITHSADGTTLPLDAGDDRVPLLLELVEDAHDLEVIRTYRFNQPIIITNTIDEIIAPDTSDSLSALIRSSLRLTWSSMRNSTSEGSLFSRQLEVDLITPPPSTSTAFAFRIDLIRDGKLIGTLHAWLRSGVYEYKTSHLWPSGDFDAILKAIDNPNGVTAQVTSDPELALRDFTARSYWSGSFEMPLSELLSTDRPGSR